MKFNRNPSDFVKKISKLFFLVGNNFGSSEDSSTIEYTERCLRNIIITSRIIKGIGRGKTGPVCVCLSICMSTLAWLDPLTYDLDF